MHFKIFLSEGRRTERDSRFKNNNNKQIGLRVLRNKNEQS